MRPDVGYIFSKRGLGSNGEKSNDPSQDSCRVGVVL